MRSIAFVLAALVVSGPAAAEWKEFNSVSEGFGVVFPADPDVQEVAMFEAVPGKMVPARIYSARYDNSLFKMTVVDLSDTAMDENTVIDHAIKTLSRGGEIKVDIPARINRVYGRQLSIAAPDGGYSSVAVFYHKQRLYQIEGTVLPGPTNATSDAIRFQQSLVFTDDSTNR